MDGIYLNNNEGLNARQLEALNHDKGPLLILAGAGSGKTRVITHKIAYLIEKKGVDPYHILAITFTNKAADEMKTRVYKLVNQGIHGIWMGTFHSIGVRILREHIHHLGYENQFSIYDRDNQLTLIKECIGELNLNTDHFKPTAILSKINDLKNSMIGAEAYRKQVGSYYSDQQLARIYALYERKLQDYNALDFDDLIIKSVELLGQHPKILEEYAGRFHYIFVDEYQDTNMSQYEMVKLLASKHRNLTVVGDGDQSIYGWRGADIRNILNFEKDYPDGKVVLLEQNYRSSQKILKAANTVIRHNESRREKNLWSQRGEGEDITYRLYNTAQEEAIETYKQIDRLVGNEGFSYEDIAILYRTNAQSRMFEEVFIKQGTPYKIIGGVRFYERKEIKDLMSYLSVINNPSDQVAIMRAINEPKRGVGGASIDKIIDFAYEEGLSFYQALSRIEEVGGLNKRSKSGIKEFLSCIDFGLNQKNQMGLSDLVEEILNLSGLVSALNQEGTIESKTRVENLEEFISVTAAFEEEYPQATLEDFMANMALLTDMEKTEDRDNAITLMTMHSAKGLEFPAVFIVGMEEGLFPSARSLTESDDEEERRLCYVAITRAEDRLFLSGARSRMVFGAHQYCLPSRFIEELGESIVYGEDNHGDYGGVREKATPKSFKAKNKMPSYRSKEPAVANARSTRDEKDFNIGDRVRHESLGEGMIVEKRERNGDAMLSISFQEGGIKKFMLSMAPIDKV